MSDNNSDFKVFGLDMRNPVSMVNMANQARFGSAFTSALSQASKPAQTGLGEQLQKSTPPTPPPSTKPKSSDH